MVSREEFAAAVFALTRAERQFSTEITTARVEISRDVKNAGESRRYDYLTLCVTGPPGAFLEIGPALWALNTTLGGYLSAGINPNGSAYWQIGLSGAPEPASIEVVETENYFGGGT